jgi:hypothetical protein
VAVAAAAGPADSGGGLSAVLQAVRNNGGKYGLDIIREDRISVREISPCLGSPNETLSRAWRQTEFQVRTVARSRD